LRPPDIRAAGAVATLALAAVTFALGHVWLLGHEERVRVAILPLDGRVVTLSVGFHTRITTLTGELFVPLEGREVFLDSERGRYTLRLGDLHDVFEA
jgi:hypothetical protein